MDKLVNIETGQIDWEAIKKLSEEEEKTDNFIKTLLEPTWPLTITAIITPTTSTTGTP